MTTSPRKKDRRTLNDVKLADMHMKRRVPQLYLSDEGKIGNTNMNEFNSQLKKSLLSPKKHRYVATKHE